MAAEIHWKDIKIRALTFELATLKRLKFGAKTEAFTAEQRDLFTETLETDLSAMQAELENLSSPPPRAKAKPPGRNPLPPELPRVEYRHEPESCSCGACGRDLVKIGEDISEQLDVEPARFFVNRHIRPQYACRTCETITAAAVPAAVIDGGLASPGLLACIAHVRRKFFDLHAADQHPVATEALHRIAELYHIESEARDYSPEQRQRWVSNWLCHDWTPCTHGCNSSVAIPSMGVHWQKRLIMASNAGRLSGVTPPVARFPLIITLPNTAFVR